MSTPPNFDAYQQVLAISAGSNLVRSDTEHTNYDLQNLLLEELTGEGGWFEKSVGPGWSVVWGPAVWRSKPTAKTCPDNVWFVAKNDSFAVDGGAPTPAYVVAIAGSAGKHGKSFDWKSEDLAVKDVVDLGEWLALPRPGGVLPKFPNPLKHADPTKPMLSRGTALGTYIIATEPPAAPPSASGSSSLTSICAFFQTLDPAPGAKLIFTGHSLGGALSPLLAAILTDGGYLDKFAKGNTLVYPTAGASPGNGQFATHFSALFPPSHPGPDGKFYQTWNQNIANTLDIVPHAWCTDHKNPFNMSVLPGIYGNDKNPLHNKHPLVWLEVAAAVTILCGKRFASGAGLNVYQPLPASTFSGDKPEVPSSLGKYEDVAGVQHVNAYGLAILGKPFPDSVVGRKEDDPLLFHGVLGAVTGRADLPQTEDEEVVDNVEADD